MPQPISNLAVGAKVKDLNTTIYSQPIVWQIADKNHSGYPANSVTLVSANIIKIMAFDGKEANNSDTNRRSYGSNRFVGSNIGQWLNKEGTNWYVAQLAADAPPSAANVTYNPYDTVAGFLTGFSAEMKAALQYTTFTVAKNTVTDGGGSETVSAKIFLLSKAEVGLGAENSINEGSLLALFNSTASSRVATPTAAAVSNSDYTSGSLKAGSGWYWWLRSPYAAYSYGVRDVNLDGTEYTYGAYYGNIGLRPALNLSSGILVSDTTGSDGAYTIIWNQPPSPPQSISVPSTIKSDSSATISWTAGIDPETSALTYELECAVNSGAFANIYTGSALSYSHAITTSMNSVQYQVRCKDAVGDYSGYQLSEVTPVIHNVAPGISGTDIDLGVISAPPSYSFSVTDPDAGDSVTVTAMLDGTNILTIDPVVLGQTYTVNLTGAQFFGMANGQHALQIVASDEYGDSSTRTVTFTRTVTMIDFQIAPIQTDAASEKILISILYYADPANIQIKVCNNALDDTPAWETAAQGLKHIFSNASKTADNWAVGVWVQISPSAQYLDVYCNSLNGSYI
jgi:hypothetical protein